MIGTFPMTLVAERLSSRWNGAADTVCTGVSTDSRTVRAGDLFVALRGERLDGHDHLEAARAAGAVAAVVEWVADSVLPQLPVFDTRRALAELAAINRERFSGVLLALTGSAGKTTTKNMTAAILAQAGITQATRGNCNNEIGVPQTLLALEAQTRFAVVEMGAARAGDIAYLMQFVCPQIALVTNAMPAHLDGFGSLDGVARGKGEIYQCLADSGTAVLNADDASAPLWQSMIGRRTLIRFGWRSGAAAEVSARAVRVDAEANTCFTLVLPAGEYPVCLPVPGLSNVSNALAAAALALAAGCTPTQIVAGLSVFRNEPGRMALGRARCGARLIDDSYNANPGAVHSAIDVLAGLPGRRVLILGEMAELGPEAGRYHVEAAEYARERGIDALWPVGPWAAAMAAVFGDGAQAFADQAALIAWADQQLVAGDSVLIKGSRLAGMERVVQALAAENAMMAGEH